MAEPLSLPHLVAVVVMLSTLGATNSSMVMMVSSEQPLVSVTVIVYDPEASPVNLPESCGVPASNWKVKSPLPDAVTVNSPSALPQISGVVDTLVTSGPSSWFKVNVVSTEQPFASVIVMVCAPLARLEKVESVCAEPPLIA